MEIQLVHTIMLVRVTRIQSRRLRPLFIPETTMILRNHIHTTSRIIHMTTSKIVAIMGIALTIGALSMLIRGPIFQVGCASASSAVTFFNRF